MYEYDDVTVVFVPRRAHTPRLSICKQRDNISYAISYARDTKTTYISIAISVHKANSNAIYIEIKKHQQCVYE